MSSALREKVFAAVLPFYALKKEAPAPKKGDGKKDDKKEKEKEEEAKEEAQPAAEEEPDDIEAIIEGLNVLVASIIHMDPTMTSLTSMLRALV
jgi:hypothetical protein